MTVKAYRDLIQTALGKGMSVTVGWQDEIDLEKTTNQEEIFDMIRNLSECHVKFYAADGSYAGYALVIPGLAPEETVADYGIKPWIDEWWNDYFERMK